jgi:hypothetical protein
VGPAQWGRLCGSALLGRPAARVWRLGVAAVTGMPRRGRRVLLIATPPGGRYWNKCQFRALWLRCLERVWREGLLTVRNGP